MSHAISQMKALRTVPQGFIIALFVVCFIGVCALLAGALSSPRPWTSGANPAVHADGGEKSPPRVHRDPAAPGRRF